MFFFTKRALLLHCKGAFFVLFFYYQINKRMGYSQLDQPIFDKYRLVKENVPEMHEDDSKTDFNNQTVNLSDYALKSDIDALTHEINALKEKVSMLSEKEISKDE